MSQSLGNSGLMRIQSADVLSVFLSILAVCVAYAVSSATYNLFFSPLRHIPGPKLWAISEIPYSISQLSGDGHIRISKLHHQYGDAVRLSPTQVSFIHPKAWKDTMGSFKSNAAENQKDPVLFHVQKNGIIGANTEDHTRIRQTLAPAFSPQSMLAQQPLITKHIDLLFKQLKDLCHDETILIDIVKWFNWTTFDVIGDLAFGEPFGCLETSSYHPWVTLVIGTVSELLLMSQIRRILPLVNQILATVFSKAIAKRRTLMLNYAWSRVDKRMSLNKSRPDFMDAMMKTDENGKNIMTLTEIRFTAATVVSAGSETTATALSGVTYLLGTHPDTLAKLTDEIRSAFTSEDEITLVSAQNLEYMKAVINESLRIYPPAPAAFPRVVHRGGDIICGKYLPGGTVVNLWQWAINHDPTNFALPDSFIPERWLGNDSRFTGDRKDSFRPFSFGPRDCIGKNLAYAEMRLILSRLVWNFNLRLAHGSSDWMQSQKARLLWCKTPLNVYLQPRDAKQ